MVDPVIIELVLVMSALFRAVGGCLVSLGM